MTSPLVRVVLVTGSVLAEDVPVPRRPGDAYIPRALQSSSGEPAPLDRWWATLLATGLVRAADITVATTATNYKAFEFWGFAKGLAKSQILNSGSSVGSDRCAGALIVRRVHRTPL